MAWRGLHLTKPGKLSYVNNQAVVTQETGIVTVPLEDIAWIIVDCPQITITAAFLSASMTQGIALVLCDATHTPNGVALPFHRHHRQAAIASMQISISVPLRKRLWQAVVQAKILNQASTLSRYARGEAPLIAMAGRVLSGDPDNVEARAARAYWRMLFANFTRDDPADLRNAMLNYGYAIVRATVARALVAAGLLPAFGIGHRSVTNAFNLADDMVEPFRPFVDAAVWEQSDRGLQRSGQLKLEHRRTLAALPTVDVALGTETMTLLAATEQVADSLVRAMQAGVAGPLLLPTLPARQREMRP